MTIDNKTPTLDRGRHAVKAGLIEAACAMLADVGPNAMSVRAVATQAGVNHGQVHHYFGGKQGLIDAAATHMAKAHLAQAGSSNSPDTPYLRGIVRLVLDGHLDTASNCLSEGLQAPPEIQANVTQSYPATDVPVEAKARVAASLALEMGWAALEPLLLIHADAKPNEVDAIRTQARQFARRLVEEV